MQNFAYNLKSILAKFHGIRINYSRDSRDDYRDKMSNMKIQNHKKIPILNLSTARFNKQLFLVLKMVIMRMYLVHGIKIGDDNDGFFL